MLAQHPHPPFGAPLHPASDVAAFFANPRQFMHDVVTSALANWQPPTIEVTREVISDPDELHDVAAAAEFLGVVTQTIHAYVKEEILTPLRLRAGGKLYFKKSDLLTALTRNGGNSNDKRRKAARTNNKKA